MSEALTYGAYRCLSDLEPPLSSAFVTIRRLDLVTNWRRCGMTADYVGEFMSLLFSDPITTSVIVSTVVNELLENAVKYSVAGNQPLTIRAPYFGEWLAFEIEHTCTAEQAERLAGAVTRLEHEDPEALFIRQLQRTATDDPDASGLGLIGLAKDYQGKLGVQVIPGATPHIVTVKMQVWVPTEVIERGPRATGDFAPRSRSMRA